jgi:hypothetical protein
MRALLWSRTAGATRLPAVRLRWAISNTRRATLRVRLRTRSLFLGDDHAVRAPATSGVAGTGGGAVSLLSPASPYVGSAAGDETANSGTQARSG